MRAVLRHRQARAFVFAQLLSSFGDRTLWLASGIWVKQVTGSSSAAGLVFFFYTVPYVAGPLVGVVVDRVRRRQLSVVVNIAAGAAVLTLVFAQGPRQLWLVYVVILAYGVAGTVLDSAQPALMATILPARLLADANGALQTGGEVLRLVSPLLGAATVAATNSLIPVVLFDAATFAVAALVLARLAIQEPRPQEATDGRWAEISAGAAHIARTPALRHIVTSTALALLMVGFSETVFFSVVELGLHRPASFLGVLLSVMGAGAVAGGLTGARLLHRIGDGATLALGLGVLSAGYLALTVPSRTVAVVSVAVSGIGIPWAVIAFTTSLQVRTPATLRGRTFAAAHAFVTVPQTISIAVGAALVSLVDYRLLLTTMGGVSLAAAVYLLTRRIEWLSPGDTVDGAECNEMLAPGRGA